MLSPRLPLFASCITLCALLGGCSSEPDSQPSNPGADPQPQPELPDTQPPGDPSDPDDTVTVPPPADPITGISDDAMAYAGRTLGAYANAFGDPDLKLTPPTTLGTLSADLSQTFLAMPRPNQLSTLLNADDSQEHTFAFEAADGSHTGSYSTFTWGSEDNYSNQPVFRTRWSSAGRYDDYVRSRSWVWSDLNGGVASRQDWHPFWPIQPQAGQWWIHDYEPGWYIEIMTCERAPNNTGIDYYQISKHVFATDFTSVKTWHYVPGQWHIRRIVNETGSFGEFNSVFSLVPDQNTNG